MLKELTNLEQRIISYLALNPNKNRQQIQHALGIEDKNYPTVSKAVIRLEKKGYLEKKEGKSEKSVLINFYRLNLLGLAYQLAYGDEKLILEVIENYEQEFPTYLDFQKFVKLLPQKTALKIIRIVGKSLLSYGLKAWDLMPAITALNALTNESFTPAELKHFKIASKKVPGMKEDIKEKAKRLYEEFSNGEPFT
jgi:DNA-binding MarR family transcriptional regulator